MRKSIIITALMVQYFSLLLGANFYVSSNGNNNNDGLTLPTAFQTIQFAVDQINPGDSILVEKGQYDGFDIRTGGSASLPIVIMAMDDSVEIINPGPITDDGINVENADWVEINGFIVNDMPRNGIRAVLSDNLIIRNNQCDNNFERGIFTGFTDSILIENNICTNSIDEHGIYFSNSGDYPIIRNNICHHNNGGGIQINADLSAGGDGITTGAIIEGNILYENGIGGGAAINLDGATESLIINNLLYNNHATGIALFKQDAATGAFNNKVYHNTVIQAPDGRWALNINNGSTGAKVYNNILLTFHSFRGSIAVDNSSLNGFDSNYNIVVDRLTARGDNFSDSFDSWQQIGYGLHSMLADPLGDIIEDSLNADFHLKMGSQAIDQGKDLSSEGVNSDLDGMVRPQGNGYDIGTYEYNVANGLEAFSREKPIVKINEETVILTELFLGDQVNIFDLNGRMLHQSAILNQTEYSISLSSGFYILFIQNPREGHTLGKILVR